MVNFLHCINIRFFIVILFIGLFLQLSLLLTFMIFNCLCRYCIGARLGVVLWSAAFKLVEMSHPVRQ